MRSASATRVLSQHILGKRPRALRRRAVVNQIRERFRPSDLHRKRHGNRIGGGRWLLGFERAPDNSDHDWGAQTTVPPDTAVERMHVLGVLRIS